jgi:hypothetical protein
VLPPIQSGLGRIPLEARRLHAPGDSQRPSRPYARRPVVTPVADKRLASWTQWLDTTLLPSVLHR